MRRTCKECLKKKRIVKMVVLGYPTGDQTTVFCPKCKREVVVGRFEQGSV